MTSMPLPCVRLENAIKEFPSGNGVIRALDQLSLEIFPGELLVVTGESGCGKSTLLNIIGFMDELTGGKLEAFGRDMTKRSEKERTLYRRRDVGFVFQPAGSFVKFPSNSSQSGRTGTTTHGKQKAVFIYIKATSGLTENQ